MRHTTADLGWMSSVHVTLPRDLHLPTRFCCMSFMVILMSLGSLVMLWEEEEMLTRSSDSHKG